MKPWIILFCFVASKALADTMAHPPIVWSKTDLPQFAPTHEFKNDGSTLFNSITNECYSGCEHWHRKIRPLKQGDLLVVNKSGSIGRTTKKDVCK